ncbi:craniofacial development protein 2-like [Maniola hyperantus]|uniref:craniofacial development protein 2-like n=1 Tax=Aphantopus hyperantus TaxID=2795564 RepID=UPI0037492742
MCQSTDTRKIIFVIRDSKKQLTALDSRNNIINNSIIFEPTQNKSTPSRLVTVGEDDYYPPNVKIKQPPRKHRHKDIIHIVTYNTLSLRTNEKLSELMMALKNINWSIIGLSEVRRLGESIEDHGDFILYYKGDTPGKYGIGFLIRKELKDYINEFIGISERIAILNIKLPPSEEMWSIVQIYSPTEQSTSTEIDFFYSTLTEVIKNHTHKNLIVMGDFNAQIGSRRNGEEIVIGPYSSGRRTRNGEKLILLAYEHNLRILNSQYKNRIGNRWTWVSPDGSYKNEIDYVLSNRSTAFKDCRVINNLNFNSNHRALRAKLVQDTYKHRPFKVKTKNKHTLLDTKELKDKAENFIGITKKLSTQDKYNKLLELLNTKTNKKTSVDGKKSLPWVSDKTRNLLEDRTKLISTPNKTKYIRRLITETSKLIRRWR